MLVQILRGTPMWVFALFAYLVWMGVKRLRPGVRNVRGIWWTPAIFIGWGVLGLLQHDGAFAQTVMDWLVGAAAGGVFGAAPRQRMLVDRLHRRVLQPGSIIPLTRNVLIFGGHYLLNVAATMRPALRDVLMNWDVVVSGLGAGYFIGWALRFVQSYRAAPQTDLGGDEPHATKTLPDTQPAPIALS